MYEFLLQATDWWLGTAIGGGLVLLVGCGLMRLARQPAARQRIGEYAVIAALVVAGLRLLPAWFAVSWSPASASGAVDPAADVAPDMAWIRIPPVEGVPEEWVARPETAKGVVFASPEPRPSQSQGVPPTQDAECSPTWTWRGIVVWLTASYLAVAALLSARWLLGQWALGRLLRQARPAAPRVRRLFTLMAAGSVWPLPQLRLSRRLRAPVCFGLRRPAVVLPEPMGDAGDTELRWVFAHELTHLRRRDPWSSWGLGLAQAVYFFLPWFWWVRRQVRLCQEYIADAAAAGEAGHAADEYAEFLVSLAKGPGNPLGATGLGNSSDLLRRVQMLLQSSTRVQPSCTRGWSLTAAGALLVVAVLAGGLGVRAEPPKDEKKKEVRIVRPIDVTAEEIVIDGKGDVLKFSPDAIRVVVRTTDDEGDEKKDEKKSEKKSEKKVERKVIVIDAGSGPIVIPFDGDGEEVKKEIEKAMKKVRVQVEATSKERGQAIEKALEALKGELSNEQIGELKKQINAMKLKQGMVEKERATADKARVDAMRQAEIAREHAEKANEHAQEAKKNADEHRKLFEDLQKQYGAEGKGEGGAKFRIEAPVTFNFTHANSGRLGARIERPSAALADQLDLPKNRGMVIVEVMKDSAAAKAGFKANDVLLEIAGKPVSSDPGAFAKQIREIEADEEVNAIVLRKGHKEKVKGIKLPEAKAEGNMQWQLAPGGFGGASGTGKFEVGFGGANPFGKVEGGGSGGKTLFAPPKPPVPPEPPVPPAPPAPPAGPKAPAAREGAARDALEHKLMELKLQMEELTQYLGTEHPQVSVLRRRAEAVQQQIKGKEEMPKAGHRSVSVQVNDGKLTAKQVEGAVAITVTGKATDDNVEIERIVIRDGDGEKSYKRLADVPEKHRETIERLTSNKDGAPVRWRSNNKKDGE